MNRMTFLFAILVAASFAIQSSQTGQGLSTAGPALQSDQYQGARSQNQPTSSKQSSPSQTNTEKATIFIEEFRGKGADREHARYQVIFATVPDPIETHLASTFDHNVAALLDGAQDSHYLFDSSWIPWELPGAYDTFVDDLSASRFRGEQHDCPGVLLFRSNWSSKPPVDPYDTGLIVFLIGEKPTTGINLRQLQNALSILGKLQVKYPDDIEILGPTFSGSLPSLVPFIESLYHFFGGSHQSFHRILIRSGGITADDLVRRALPGLDSSLYDVPIDFGSAQHPYRDWITIATNELERAGTKYEQIAVLAEDESAYGGMRQARVHLWRS